MKPQEKAAPFIRDLEAKLRELVGEAASAGDYEAVLHLTSLAKGAALLAESNASGDLIARLSPDTRPRAKAASSDKPSRSTPAKPRSKRKKKRRKKKSRAKAGYPKFLRRGKYLVKIGYSKKSGEYAHRALKRIVTLFAKAVAQAGAGKRLFTAEEFMPVTDTRDGTEVPSYQAYLCLAWLKHEKMIEAEGRQGYRIVTAKPLAEAAKESWSALASG